MVLLQVKFKSPWDDPRGPLRRGLCPGRRRWPGGISLVPWTSKFNAAEGPTIPQKRSKPQATLAPQLTFPLCFPGQEQKANPGKLSLSGKPKMQI